MFSISSVVPSRWGGPGVGGYIVAIVLAAVRVTEV